MKIEIKTEKKTMTTEELGKALKKQGVEMGTVYVDGNPVMGVGVTSEADKKACEKAIKLAVENSNSISDAMSKLMTLCRQPAPAPKKPEPKPDPVVTAYIMGKSVQLNLKNGIATDSDGNVLAKVNPVGKTQKVVREDLADAVQNKINADIVDEMMKKIQADIAKNKIKNILDALDRL